MRISLQTPLQPKLFPLLVYRSDLFFLKDVLKLLCAFNSIIHPVNICNSCSQYSAKQISTMIMMRLKRSQVPFALSSIVLNTFHLGWICFFLNFEHCASFQLLQICKCISLPLSPNIVMKILFTIISNSTISTVYNHTNSQNRLSCNPELQA